MRQQLHRLIFDLCIASALPYQLLQKLCSHAAGDPVLFTHYSISL